MTFRFSVSDQACIFLSLLNKLKLKIWTGTGQTGAILEHSRPGVVICCQSLAGPAAHSTQKLLPHPPQLGALTLKPTIFDIKQPKRSEKKINTIAHGDPIFLNPHRLWVAPAIRLIFSPT